MFLKPISVKSCNQVKSMKKKQLATKFTEQFNLSTAASDCLFGETKVVYCLRILTSSNVKLNVYKFGEVPYIIEREDKLLPTICLLWQLPDLLPHFKVHENLLPTLMNGADLMLPGVVYDRPLTPTTFNNIDKDVLCSISTVCNKSPIAIGYTTMSNHDIYMSVGKGKVVAIFHVLGDRICSLGDVMDRPLIPWVEANQPSDLINHNLQDIQLDNCESNSNPVASYDDLLEDWFLKGIKQVRQNQLPMQVNVFYSQHILAHKKETVEFDIKKTSFKRVLTFLRSMENKQYIKLTESKPGVFSLAEIDKSHVGLRTITVSETQSDCRQSSNVKINNYLGPPTIAQTYFVKGKASVIFTGTTYKGGDAVTPSEVKRTVDNYVRSHNLQCKEDPSMVIVDALLAKYCDPVGYVESSKSTLANPIYMVSFRNLVSTTFKHLHSGHLLNYPQSVVPHVLSNKIPKIHLYTLTKAGKHLTRVADVDIFNIDPDQFSKQLQVNLACSAGRVDDEHRPRSVVIQAQGSHIVAISSLLANSYGIPKHYINGFQEAKKKKK